MFPTQSKVNRTSRLWLLPVVALAMLLVGYAVFAANTAQAQTPAGDFCIEGIVIDWQEKPLAGYTITLSSDTEIPGEIGGVSTTVSAPSPEDDPFEDYNKYDKKSKQYPYEYPDVDPAFEKGEFAFKDLNGVAANYVATITLPAGWEGVTPTTVTFPIEVGEEGCVKIRFKVRRIVPVIVYKIDADHQPLGDWIIRAIPGPGNLFASPQQVETSDPMTVNVGTVLTPTIIITGGTAVFTLTPGLWIFTEQAPKIDKDDPQEGYVPIVPPNGRQELFIPDPEDLDEGESFTLVFKNELVTGCFIVRKFGVIPTADASPEALGTEFAVAGWGIKVLRKDGTVARQGVTDGNGEIRFDNLPLGPYVIIEEDRPGWDETTADLFGPARDFNVAGNYCDEEDDPAVEFRNEQDESGFCIEGRKTDANGGYGIMNWEIAIKPLDEGGYDPANVFTNGVGEFQVDFPRDDYRIPGAKYEVCEQEQDGWLPHTETCQTVRLPEWPGACVQLEDFVNQQVGHTESQKPEYPDKGDDYGKGDEYGKGGPEGDSSYGGPEGENHEGSEYGGPEGESHEGSEYGGPEGENHEGSEYGGPEGENHEGGQYGGPEGGQREGGEYGNQNGGHEGGEYDGGENAQCSSYHVVKAGEGLYDIGSQYHKTPQQMLDANPSVRDGDELWVYEGQSICIP